MSATWLDETKLAVAGGEGCVYILDTRTNQCLDRFQDEGSLKTTTISSTQHLLATGSTSGIVNIYNLNDYSAPIKAIENLTTNIDCLTFNPDGEILGLSSKWKANGARLYHCGAKSVFANWPKAGLAYPTAMAFAPQGDVLAVGNDEGNVHLYDLNYYKS